VVTCDAFFVDADGHFDQCTVTTFRAKYPLHLSCYSKKLHVILFKFLHHDRVGKAGKLQRVSHSKSCLCKYCILRQGYFRFWDLGGLLGGGGGGGGEDNLFPSEGIEMMSGFTNCTSTVSDYLFLCSRLYALPFTSLILIKIFTFHFGRKCPPPQNLAIFRFGGNSGFFLGGACYGILHVNVLFM
jgi:hypothetical protein